MPEDQQPSVVGGRQPADPSLTPRAEASESPLLLDAAGHPTSSRSRVGPDPRSGIDSGEAAPARPRPPRKRWWPFALLVLIVLGLVFLFTRKPKTAQADPAMVAPAAPTIKTATAHTGDIGMYVDALGTVTPLAMVNLYSQVNGRIVAVHYVEGQMVHKGDPLIDIDPRPYQAQLTEAQGTLAKDRGVLAQAEMDLTRYKQASDQQAISRQTYEDQRLLVEQDRGTVTNDEGSVAYAEVQLSYCHLSSPISGRVGLRLVDPGNVIFSGSSTTLVVVTQLQPVTVVFNVPEDSLDQVRGEMVRRRSLPVEVFDRSQQRKLAAGKLLTLDNLVDTSTGTVRFRGQFANQDLGLFPNQFVNTRLLVKTLHDAVLIPSAAVQRNGTQAFVYVVNGDAVKARQITELTTEGEAAAVEGVRAGEVVSITGFDKLEDGMHVKVEGRLGAASGHDGAAGRRAEGAARGQL